MNYLLDTDIVSAHLKSRGKVADRVVQQVGSLHVSVICVGELKTWTRRRRASPQRDVDLDIFLRNVVVLPVTYEIACCFGDLRAGLLD
ncbi:MAG: type II toxin-antitoxin system VapC family toxin [Planctomycetaceae bacterium]|nr:type II toxin-antitoxin system VapC family toxin [Planctomycetaceae bacterium]